MSAILSDEATAQSILLERDYRSLLGISLLVWDHAITFQDEVTFIWPTFPSRSALNFIVLRYTMLLNHLIVLVAEIIVTIPVHLRFMANLSANFVPCSTVSTFNHIFQLLKFTVPSTYVWILISMRVYALYEKRKLILACLLGVAAIGVGIAVWSILAAQDGSTALDAHCISPGPSRSSAAVKAGAWEALLFADSVVFFLTLWRSYRFAQRTAGLAVIPLLKTIVRDGALYFGVMVFANAANVITFFVSTGDQGPLQGSLSTFSGCISVAMMCRMTLNLFKTSAEETTARDTETTELTLITRMED
ncbi:hypothetical protein DL96DRAFT_1708575 [Flagelloscypha sp. PMI_526]|nr:hypothetical protein DL96DRAFT_1708575 [Flagelloscypha sp. PMI_526]